MRRPEGLSARQRVTRAVALVVLTLVVPGTAQLAAGSRRIGAIAVRIWLGAVGLVALLAALWFVSRTAVLHLVTNSALLATLAVLLFVIAVAWPLLVADAWRLGRPMLLPRRARLAMSGLMLVSVLATSLPVFAAGSRMWAAADLLDGVFGGGAASKAVQGRYNVLLLGGDAGADRTGLRPDSMTLASIDATTGRTVLFSLPRNLENVHFPAGSSGAQALPQGFNCGDKCLLNGLYTWGQAHASAFPGARDPGAAAMKQAVEGVTGLTVNYYVLIDLQGFRRLIDAMGGIEVTVKEKVPIGGETSRISGYIQPGTQHLDGYHALWYARSRTGASDYARMARQRCVMDAMVKQLDPATVLAKFQGLASATKDVMSTDIPASALAGFLDLGTKAKSQKLTSVAFVPPLVNPAYPDFPFIHQRVVQALIDSRAGRTTSSASPTASSSGAASAGTASSASSGKAASAGTAASPTAAATRASSVAAASPTPLTSAQAATAPATDVASECAPA